MKRRKLKWQVRILLTIFLIVIGCLLTDLNLRPLIKRYAQYQATVIATNTINRTIEQELSDNLDLYRDLITVSTTHDDTVTSIQTDSVRINLLKSKLTNLIGERLAAVSTQNIDIPVGTMLGAQILSGRGPKLNFKVIPTGFVQSQIKNQFTSAGINQTLHQIILQIDVSVAAIIPGYTTTTEVTTNFVIAETIIVGKVPLFVS